MVPDAEMTVVGEQLVVNTAFYVFRVDRYTRFKTIFHHVRKLWAAHGLKYDREPIFRLACRVERKRDAICAHLR